MAQPTDRSVHIDNALSNLAIGYKNEAYIADTIFSVVPVEKQSDKYFIFTKEFWFRNHVERRGPGANYAEGGFEVSNDEYGCVNKGLSFPIPWEVTQNADAAINMERDGADWLGEQFMIDREIALKDKIMDASAWGSDTTKSSTGQWSDYENSDPISDIQTGIETIQKAIGRVPNVALMGVEVWNKLRRHPDLLDMYKYTQSGKLNEAQVAQAIDVDRLAIGKAIYESAAEGQSFSGAYIWDKNMILMYVSPNPGIRVPSAGYTFLWKQQGFTVAIENYNNRLRRRAMLLGDSAFDQKITASDCGYEIINAVA